MEVWGRQSWWHVAVCFNYFSKYYMLNLLADAREDISLGQ